MGWLEFFVLLFAAISATAALVTVWQAAAALKRAERIAAEEERHRQLTLLARSAKAVREIGRLVSSQSILEANFAQAELEVTLAALGAEPALPATRVLARLPMDEEISPDIAADAREALTEIADALSARHKTLLRDRQPDLQASESS